MGIAALPEGHALGEGWGDEVGELWVADVLVDGADEALAVAEAAEGREDEDLGEAEAQALGVVEEGVDGGVADEFPARGRGE